MASGFTNRGKTRLLSVVFNNGTEPANYYAYLITDSSTPTADTNTWSDVSANEAANYTGEQTLQPGTAAFGTAAEDDTNDWATITMGDITFTASGGTCTARWVIITDDNGTEANRDVIAWLDLTSNQNFTAPQTMTVTGTVLKLT